MLLDLTNCLQEKLFTRASAVFLVSHDICQVMTMGRFFLGHAGQEHHCSSNSAQMEAITDLKVTVDKLTQSYDAAQLEIGATAG